MARLAKENDKEFVKKLWSVCFDDTAEFIDWKFDNYYLPQNTVIAEDNGNKAAAMQLIPYTLNLLGRNIPVRYVSGVSTLPEFRNRGMARNLFKFGLPFMNSEKADISLLVADVNGMYEKFGYTKICDFNFYPVPDTECSEIRDYDTSIIPILDRIYRKNMESYSAYLERTKEDWENIIYDVLYLEKGYIMLCENGYALVYPYKDTYAACEICGIDKSGLTPLKSSPVMARIINAESVLNKFGFDDISVTDDFISANNIGESFANKVSVAELCEKVFKLCDDMYIDFLL